MKPTTIESMMSQIGLIDRINPTSYLDSISETILKAQDAVSNYSKYQDMITPFSQMDMTTKSILEDMSSHLGITDRINPTSYLDSISETILKAQDAVSNYSKYQDMITPFSQMDMTTKSILEDMSSHLGITDRINSSSYLDSISEDILKVQDTVSNYSKLQEMMTPISQMEMRTKSLLEDMTSHLGITDRINSSSYLDSISEDILKVQDTVSNYSKLQEMMTPISQMEMRTKSLLEDMTSHLGITDRINSSSYLDSISETISKSQEIFSKTPEEIDIIFNNLNMSLYESIEVIENNNIDEENKNSLKKQINEIIEILPHLNTFFKSLDQKKFLTFIFISLYMVHSVFTTIYTYYSIYNELVNSDQHYKVNTNNGFIRSSPNVEDNNIMERLNKKDYVRKIESNSNGWVKIQFETEDEIMKEGWVYRTKITKMD